MGRERKKKELKNHLYKYIYASIPRDMDNFWTKMCISYHFSNSWMWMLGSTSLTMLHTLLWLCYVHAWFRLFEFNNSWLILVVTSQVWWHTILEVKSFVNAPLHASRIKLGQLAQLASSIKWNNTDVNTNVNIKIRHFFSSFAAFVSSLWLRLLVFFFFFFSSLCGWC